MTSEELLQAIEQAAIEKVIKLDLSHNQLTKLPPEIGGLTRLLDLNISGNQLTSLPPEIGRLTHLSRLNISGNQLTSLPPEIGRLTHLFKLNISGNQLTSLPPEIGQLIHLCYLNISENQLTRFPLEIRRISELYDLNISGNELTSLPSEIGQLIYLCHLNISRNKLTSLPPEIGKLAIEYLIASENQLTSLPPEIGEMNYLMYLDINRNKLKSLPSQIGEMNYLIYLDVSGNQLTSLPPEIGQIPHLSELKISRNKLTMLPPEIGQLKNISELFLRDRLINEIKVYRNKWRGIEFSTRLGDRALVTKSIKAVYQTIHKKEPNIIFFESPYQALSKIDSQLGIPLKPRLENLPPRGPFAGEIIIGGLNNQLNHLLHDQLSRQFNSSQSNNLLTNKIEPEFWAPHGGWFKFCVSIGSDCREIIDLYGVLSKNWGWIFPFEDVCLVCDLPRILRLDNQRRIHAEGKPAIQFADGFSIYAYRGVRLPEEYGKLHPQKWRSEWLLSEDNAELRRVLIQGIGYDLLCQELQATELDYWQGYSLLRIDKIEDFEPIHLLKMSCPSTNYIHVLRVPPDIELAREAIRWVNWGIDPKEFLIQS